MVNTGSLFSQILSLIRRDIFGKIVQELRAEKGAKGFTCWDQLVAMLFCQLAQAKSIREIRGGLQSCEVKLRHLGLTEAPNLQGKMRLLRESSWASNPCCGMLAGQDSLSADEQMREGRSGVEF
jgi:hypothetical protein